MKIEEINIDDITPYQKNPRKNDKAVDTVATSIKEYGMKQPIVVDINNVVVVGDTRLKALKKLGYKTAPIIRAEDLNQAQIKGYRLMDNKSNEMAEWDDELLNQELEELKDMDFDVNLTGFEDTEIKSEDSKSEEDDYELPAEEEIKTNIQKGDIFQIGNHRLMCGDATSEEDVDKLMNGQKADMVFTDPPYGINVPSDNSKRGKKTSLMKGGLKHVEFKDDSTQYAIKAFKICEELKIPVQVWFGANYYAHSIPETNNWLVWDKRVEEKMSNTNSDCELAWVKSENNSVRIFRHLWNGLIKESENKERRVHPTQKPIKLAEWCFNRYCPEGKKILELFGGSGSTLIACEQLNRNCYMMELDPKYCQVIIDRIKKYNPDIDVKCLNREIKA